MRIALVHDYLNQYGGAERVLETLMEMFPEAPVYTLLHDPAKTFGKFTDRVKKTSVLDFQFARDNHRWFIPLMPIAAGMLDLGDEYDLVISDTAGYAKGIKHGAKTKHISYIHTPLRYAWETDYLNFQFSIINLQFWKPFLKPVINYLKNWDFEAGQKPNILISNSSFIAGKVKDYYGRDSEVVYPPVDSERFYYVPKSYDKDNTYYLAIGRLLHYKRFDLVVDAFAKLGFPLKIVGSGPESENLKLKIENLKSSNIELIPASKTDDELRQLYGGAKALIFPQVEDFGLVAAEAQACGAPVIAYAAGGALEIVQDGKTGALFNVQTPEGLMEAVQRFEQMRFNRKSVSMAAKKFSKVNFKKQILSLVGTL
ncbi:MAG: Uncharacterized protein G01um10143_28 [Parcubacteria group bacterium Gr01-1014_3]|nr:MAG: Uncharacterized protein G01um10143_28 [Parcubacteria group bacterium Gr01-1014_3]